MHTTPAPVDPAPENIPYAEVLESIIQRFVQLVGTQAAVNAARRVHRLFVDDDGRVLDFDRDDPVGSITLLIEQFRLIFGEAALMLSHKAARPVARQHTESLLPEVASAPSARVGPGRILLVDDHVLFREGILSLLSSQPDLKVVGEAETVRDAVALARSLQPDLVLMDFSLPDGSGLEATQAILAERPDAKVVFLTVHDDDERLFGAIRAGATGYLFKNVRAAELLKSLRGVLRGEAGISPALARRILDEFSRLPAAPPPGAVESIELTARELEVVRELARGASNREIARRLVISENTVKNHVRNVLGKLQVRSRRDIVSYARSHGLIPPSDPSSSRSP